MVTRVAEAAPGANWAGTLSYGARRLLHPHTVDELRDLVVGTDRVRALGSRHSFSDIADTTGDLVDLRALPATVEIDPDARVACVTAGMTYGAVSVLLERDGWALGNLASLPHISVAGAVATGTHGSGVSNPSLAAGVRELEWIGAGGDIRRLARGDAGFAGSVVSLGALGIVTRLWLDIEPSFEVRQRVWDDVAFDAVIDDLDAVLSCAYSVSVFTDWAGDRVQQLWVKQRAEEPDLPERLFGGTQVTGDRHPIPGLPGDAATPQGGVAGPWLDRLPHFRMEFAPSAGDEIQSEYLVPSAHGADAIRALRALGERMSALVQVSEIRSVAADDLWLSPSSGAQAIAFHFTWKRDVDGVAAITPELEGALAPFAARPHWGKVHSVPADVLRRRYPRYDDFVQLVRASDPNGKFSNDALCRWFPELGVSGAAAPERIA